MMDDNNLKFLHTSSSLPTVSQSQKTFAETTANVNFPKKDQAIVFNTIDDVPQIEYIKAFSQLTTPNNIKFASRISNNRFCIYFASKNIVEQIITKQPFIIINNTEIPFRRLFNLAKRIIISNVQPIIPNDIITNAITKLSIKILSPITFMKAGFANDEYGHIGSFRRQLYIHPDDNEKLPSSILINFDQTDYRIFFTDDTVICYVCKQTGHTSNHCKKESVNITTTTHYSNPNITPDSLYAEYDVQQDPNINGVRTNLESSVENNPNQIANNLSLTQETVVQVKRSASSQSSNNNPVITPNTENPTKSPTTLTITCSVTGIVRAYYKRKIIKQIVVHSQLNLKNHNSLKIKVTREHHQHKTPTLIQIISLPQNLINHSIHLKK